MSTLHPSFPSVLVSKIISVILPDAEHDHFEAEAESISLESPSAQDLSYQICAASWAHWLLSRFQDPNALDDEEKEEKRLDAVIALVTGLRSGGDDDGTKA